MVAVRSVDSSKNRVLATCYRETFLDAGSRNRHTFARQVARGTGPPVGPHILEKRPCFVDASCYGAERFGGPVWIPEERSVGNKFSVLAADRPHSYQHCDSEKNSA